MPGFAFQRIEGSRGEIWVPALAILVGRLDRPILIRRPPGDDTPTVGQFDLQAVYSYLQRGLFEDADFTKSYTVYIGKKPLKVALSETSKIEVIEHARALRVEGVNIEWQHPE